MVTDNTATEPLIISMIRTLRDEASNAGDDGAVWACDDALDGCEDGRTEVARIINAARGMDDSKPYVEVVA